MRYTVILSLDIEAAGDAEAAQDAQKLDELLKSPMVRMSVETQGIRLSGDGNVTVYRPKPALRRA